MDQAPKTNDLQPTITNVSTTIFQGVDPKPDQIDSDFATLRYSYPSYDNRRKDERFSLPSPSTKMNIDDVVEETVPPRSTTKLSITTPQSPLHSPSYSLLITSTTSSDNSSRAEKPEPTAKRKDLTLNLRSAHQLPSDNNLSQISEPTSLSLTPSEIGYQQMQKQANMSTDTTPKSETGGPSTNFYEYIKPGGENILNMSPIKSSPSTPVRATINITYNLKSPTREQAHDYEEVFVEKEKEATDTLDPEEKKGLLETSFDENVVYEQVKFLKSVVNDVNEIIYDDVGTPMDTTEKQETDEEDVPERPPIPDNYPTCSQTSGNDHEVPKTDSDVSMSDPDVVDSLEYDQQVSLYENVKQPKPKAVYENMKYDNNKRGGGGATMDDGVEKGVYEDNEVEYKFEVPTKIELKPPSSGPNLRSNVRQLANRFETSPIDVAPPFDFTPNKVATKSPSKKAIKDASSTITRSLDENAFVREFGSTRKLSTTKESSVGQDMKGVLIESNCRRKNGDSLKPKTLNQPKKLPGLKQESEYCKMDSLKSVKKEPPIPPPKITPTTENRISLVQQNLNANNNNDNNVPSDDEKSTSSISSLRMLGSCKLDRERIEKIKEERRQALNEKFRSESFKTSAENKVKSKSRPDVRDVVDKESIKPLSESLRIKSKSRAELSASKLSIDSSTDATAGGTTGLIRTRHNSESRKGATTFTTAAPADTKDSNNHFHSLHHPKQQQPKHQQHLEQDCDSNKVELRRSNNKLVDVGRRSVDYTRGTKDKFKSLDPNAT